jgi:small subunit ribosomal protein S6
MEKPPRFVARRTCAFCSAAPPGSRSLAQLTSGTSPEEEPVRERRRDYELMLIISPLAANEEGVNAAVDRIRGVVESNGGEVTAVNQGAPWGRRKLAYPIREYVSGEASRRNFTEGYYVLLNLSIGAAKVVEIERTIKLTDTILRHLITLVEQKGAAPAAAAETSEAVANKEEA